MKFLKSDKIEDVTVGYFHEFILKNKPIKVTIKFEYYSKVCHGWHQLHTQYEC